MSSLKVGAKKLWFIFIVVVFIAILSCYIAIYVIRIITYTRIEMIRHSDMSLLNSNVREELYDYYKDNGAYPNNLNILKEPLLKSIYPNKLPKGPNVMDYFDKIKYSTDGNSYNITWEAKQNKTIYIHKEEGQKGEPARTELYINGKLSERTKE